MEEILQVEKCLFLTFKIVERSRKLSGNYLLVSCRIAGNSSSKFA